MKRAYRYSVLYFTLFGLLLLLSGLWLFALKIGFTPEDVTAYYLGSADTMQQAKSHYGLLETALPHFGAMGLFIMVTGHFFLFAPKHRQSYIRPIVILLFVAALLNILSPFGIIAHWSIFIWVKIIAFILLQLLGLYLLWVLLSEVLRTLYHHREI